MTEPTNSGDATRGEWRENVSCDCISLKVVQITKDGQFSIKVGGVEDENKGCPCSG